MDYAKRLVLDLVVWLIVVNLKIVRILGRGEIGQVVFGTKEIIMFPKGSKVGYLLTGQKTK
jgi:hypothetical protein